MVNQPLVSVVMATYNGEAFLPMMLESIAKQTYKNLEIVIVDDRSSDKTVDLLESFAKIDGRVNLILKSVNGGAVATFEQALRESTGEFIALADQDDWFREDKIERQIRCMYEKPEVDMVVSDLRLINAEGEQIAPSMWKYQRLPVEGGHPIQKLLYANFVTGCATMIRRRLLDVAFPFPSNIIMHDWWLSVLSARSEGGGIALLHESLTYYRQHGSNVVGSHDGGIAASVKRVPLLKVRCDWYGKNVARLDAYLGREHLWTESEIQLMRELKSCFLHMSNDEKNSAFVRVFSLYSRLRFALRAGLVHAVGVFGLALFPRLVDWLGIRNGLNGKSS